MAIITKIIRFIIEFGFNVPDVSMSAATYKRRK